MRISPGIANKTVADVVGTSTDKVLENLIAAKEMAAHQKVSREQEAKRRYEAACSSYRPPFVQSISPNDTQSRGNTQVDIVTTHEAVISQPSRAAATEQTGVAVLDLSKGPDYRDAPSMDDAPENFFDEDDTLVLFGDMHTVGKNIVQTFPTTHGINYRTRSKFTRLKKKLHSDIETRIKAGIVSPAEAQKLDIRYGSRWSKWEKNLFLSLVSRYGCDIGQIHDRFPTRTRKSLGSFYRALLKIRDNRLLMSLTQFDKKCRRASDDQAPEDVNKDDITYTDAQANVPDCLYSGDNFLDYSNDITTKTTLADYKKQLIDMDVVAFGDEAGFDFDGRGDSKDIQPIADEYAAEDPLRSKDDVDIDGILERFGVFDDIF